MVGTVTSLRTARSGLPFPLWSRDLSVLQNIQTGSGAHAASYSRGTGFLSSEVNRPGRVANQSSASSAEVMIEWGYGYLLCDFLLSFFVANTGIVRK